MLQDGRLEKLNAEVASTEIALADMHSQIYQNKQLRLSVEEDLENARGLAQRIVSTQGKIKWSVTPDRGWGFCFGGQTFQIFALS